MLEKIAASTDLDGFVFPEVLGLLRKLNSLSHNKLFELKRNPSCTEDSALKNRRLSLREQAELIYIRKRSVIPEAAETLKRIQADVIIANTGRSDNPEMVALTIEQLRRGGILDTFESINFKPNGISPYESKYRVLKQLAEKGYTKIIHYDDKETAISLAKKLPDVQFIIPTSGILFSRSKIKNTQT